MSNITGLTPANHAFVVLEKNTNPLSGQRLVRLIAKSARGSAGGDKNPNLTQSMAVSIPFVSTEAVVEMIDKLLPHVIGMVQDAQDKIIREHRIESGSNEINQRLIDVDAVIAYLDASAAGDRVSKEYLTEWFTDTYGVAVVEWIGVISGGGLAEVVIDQKCAVMRDMIAGWSSPKYSPNIPALKAMIRFVSAMSESDQADARLVAIGHKASAMLTKKESELSTDALGF